MPNPDRHRELTDILYKTAFELMKINHLSMEFPTDEGIGVQKGDQRKARECLTQA
jgi:hypothetical protein